MNDYELLKKTEYNFIRTQAGKKKDTEECF